MTEGQDLGCRWTEDRRVFVCTLEGRKKLPKNFVMPKKSEEEI